MLEKLLKPESIAVIGASRTPGKVGYEIVNNLKEGGFGGTIVPVNPATNEIESLACYPDLRAYGGKIDMAVIAIPNALVLKAVDEALDAGAQAVVVITAGFREVGEEGARLEEEVADRCREHKARLLGPNCLGLLNAHHNMNASFAKHMPVKGGISVISQSGALCTAILDWAASQDLGLSKLVSMGNKADLSESDFLTEFSKDSETNVIVGYLENIGRGDAFLKVAQQASQKKPVIILKSGTTAAGGKAASSHTGSLAGTDIAYGAAFSRSGVVRAETFEALFDYAMAFAMQPLPAGKRVAIITNAGGPGIMAADAAELAGLDVCSLESASATALAARLPAAASIANPIDVLGDADPERYAAAVKAAQEDPGVDSIVVILTPQAMTLPVETAEAIAASVDGSKPVVASFMGGMDVSKGRKQLMTRNIPEYPSPERAVTALKAMSDYSAWVKRPPRVLTRFRVNRRRVERIIRRHEKTGSTQVSEAHAKAILRAYDFTVPQGKVVTNADEAIEVAHKMGFPVAMKIASPDIIHKSDIGGVKLNLQSADAVRDAFDLMIMRVQQRVADARIDGVYVEQMCQKGREVILGMTRDPQFGPLLMFGLGGIFVEVMKDVTFHIAPVTAEEALHMLESTRSYSLLQGVRGEGSVDLQAIAEALQRISQLVTDFPVIQEMDINPFIVGHRGQMSVAADARITLNLG